MNIIITGASRGIGFDTALQLASTSKHKILALSRNEVQLNKLAPLSLRIVKYGMYKILDTPVAQAEREFKKYVQPQFDSEDFKEGARAFQEKRDPVFKGR